MSSTLTVRVPSPQPAAPTAGTRGFATRGNDGSPSGSTGFDAVLADHAAPARSPHAKTKPAPAARRPGADVSGATHVSRQGEKAGPTPMRTRSVKASRDDSSVPLVAGAPVAPAAVDMAAPKAVDATAASSAGAPVEPGSDVVPVLSTLVPPATLPTESGGPSVAPGVGSGGTSASVTAGGVVVGLGHLGPQVPPASGPGVVSLVSASVPSTTPPAGSGSPVVAVAGAPTVAPGTGSSHASAVLAAAVPAVAPGQSGPEAATAPSVGVVPQLSSSATPYTPATVSGAVMASPLTPRAARDDVAGAAATAGSSVLPGQSGPEAATAPSVGVVQVPSTPVPPTTASGAGGSHTSAATVAADGGVVPSHAEVATTPGTTSPGQPVDAAVAASLAQSQPPVTDAARPGGPQPTPGLGVVPVVSTPAPSLSASSVAGTASIGRPGQFSFPEAVHQQVFTAVSPLLRGADGSYGIQLNLRPHDLGAVQVNVDMRHGEISIQMHATDPAARDALRGGLSELRQQLEDQGLRAGSMDVGSGGAHARQPETSWSRSPVIEPPTYGGNPSDPLVAPAASASSTALDLRM